MDQGVKRKKAAGFKSSKKTELVKLEEGKGDIIQPLTFTMMRMDTTAMQNKAVVAVVNKLQEMVRMIMNRGGNWQTTIAQLQTEDVKQDHGVSMKIYLNEFGVEPRNYADLRDSIIALAGLTVKLPYKSPDGKKFMKYTNFCDVYFEEGVRSHYVILTLDEDVADKLINLDFGYQMINKVVILNNVKNKYAQKLYTYLMMWTSKESFVVTTKELRENLCIVDKYPSFRHVVQRVLEPARKELQELADKGCCDYYFDYEKIYPGTKRTGEPEKILFKIHKSKVFVTQADIEADKRGRQQIANLLKSHFGFDDKEAAQLSKKVNHLNCTEYLGKLVEIEQYAAKPEVKDKKAYCAKALNQFVKDSEALVEELA